VDDAVKSGAGELTSRAVTFDASKVTAMTITAQIIRFMVNSFPSNYSVKTYDAKGALQYGVNEIPDGSGNSTQTG